MNKKSKKPSPHSFGQAQARKRQAAQEAAKPAHAPPAPGKADGGGYLFLREMNIVNMAETTRAGIAFAISKAREIGYFDEKKTAIFLVDTDHHDSYTFLAAINPEVARQSDENPDGSLCIIAEDKSNITKEHGFEPMEARMVQMRRPPEGFVFVAFHMNGRTGLAMLALSTVFPETARKSA